MRRCVRLSSAFGSVAALVRLGSRVCFDSSDAARSVRSRAQPTAFAAGHCRNHDRRSGAAVSAAAAPRSATYADRRERRFRESRFVRGCRTKVLSQRKTLAVDHHHPLRALATLGFSDSSAPFLAGAKLPSRKDSLHCSCFRWLSSARNARQILSPTPCSSQSRSLRQQVAGEGNSSGKSCQRAPLRRIHKMPSSTLRSEARGRPPRRRERGRGSKGRIFSHWASLNRRPYRAIGPPAALLTLFISHFRQPNYLRIQALHPVLKQLLQRSRSSTPHSAGGSPTWNERTNCLKHCRRNN